MPKLSRWSLFVVFIFGLQLAVSATVHKSFGLTAFGDTLQTALVCFALVAVVRNARSSSGTTRVFWSLMSVGFALWLITQLTWSYVEVVQKLDVPNPFYGDIILFVHVVPFMGALAMQPQAELGSRRFGLTDFMLLLVWWIYLYL